MTPARVAQVLAEAGEIPPARRSAVTRLLEAADAADAFSFDELEPRARDTEPPACAPTLLPPAPAGGSDG